MFFKTRRKKNRRSVTKCLPSTQAKSEHPFHKKVNQQSSSSVRVFPWWTLIFFWSTSLGRGITDEVTSCLFQLHLRDQLQMWLGREVGCPVKRQGEDTPPPLFLRVFQGRLNVAVCLWYYLFWEASVKWPKYTRRALKQNRVMNWPYVQNHLDQNSSCFNSCTPDLNWSPELIKVICSLSDALRKKKSKNKNKNTETHKNLSALIEPHLCLSHKPKKT